ncbi:MAG TPA: hypothetical protein VER33_01035 [Polyangiaceae bacterium]|nr:hypothetical protein [Polyangiaceae bacterium]
MRARLLLVGLVTLGCLAPPPPAERATDAARSLNLAARFGRMDVALGLTDEGAQQLFLEHRLAWGKDVRLFDVELASFAMKAPDVAQVEVDYSWSRTNEAQLRTTRVAQEWRDSGGGFRLVRERHLQGDVGLFGEAPAKPSTAPHHDAQFATKIIP